MAKAPANKSKSSKPKFKMKREEALKFYRDMLLIRRFEERAGQLYGMGKTAGFCHLYIGQEAVVTGMQARAATRLSMMMSYSGLAGAFAKALCSTAIPATPSS